LIGTLEELYPLDLENDSSSSSSSDVAADSTADSSTDSSSSSTSRACKSASDDFVVIEYVLLKDVNDRDEDAARLLQLLSRVYCMINLIVFNPHEGTAFQKTDEAQVCVGTAGVCVGGWTVMCCCCVLLWLQGGRAGAC
jgi:23S rRNA (adenine2503-C2)-methyltransferase